MSGKVLLRCGLVLAVALLALAMADNNRPWKQLQTELFELERLQLQTRLDAIRAAAEPTVADLEEQIATQEALLEGRRDEILELEDDLKSSRGKARAAELRRERLESQHEHARYAGDAGTADLLELLRQTRIEIESLDELIRDREHKLAAIRSDLTATDAQLTKVRAPANDLERRLAELPARSKLPLYSLLAPGVAVREVRIAETPGGDPAEGVDRCATCHLAAIREDVETGDWPAPLRRHPDPELFVDADSPHPYRRLGCTSCHGGDGRTTDFTRAGHLPASAEQADTWAKAWGFREGETLRPMLPLALTEATCGRCHGGEVSMTRTPLLETGRRLIVALGCTGCHPSDQPAFANPSKAGPSMARIASKTTPAWVYRWLGSSPSARRTGRMPHFFSHEGEASGDHTAEIRAIRHLSVAGVAADGR